MTSRSKKPPKFIDTTLKYVNIEPKRKYKVEPSKKTALVNKGIATLDTYKSTDIIRQSMIDLIKKQYSDRHIQNPKTAVSALKSLMSGDNNEFNNKYLKITKLVDKKQCKNNSTREKNIEAQRTENAEIFRSR